MMLKTAFAMNPGNEQEKVHTHLEEARLQNPQAEVSSASNQSTNRTSSKGIKSSSKRKPEAKATVVKERGSQKKNKLVSGGQDELGILKGILDDGSIRSTIEASRGKVHKAKSNNKNKKKSRNHR
jgi:hypothetical protein